MNKLNYTESLLHKIKKLEAELKLHTDYITYKELNDDNDRLYEQITKLKDMLRTYYENPNYEFDKDFYDEVKQELGYDK